MGSYPVHQSLQDLSPCWLHASPFDTSQQNCHHCPCRCKSLSDNLESSIYTSANSFDIIITILLLSLSTMPKQKLAAIPYRHLDDKSPSQQLHKDSQSMESINAAQSTRENQLEKNGHTWTAWEVEMAKFIFVNFLVSMHFEAWNFFVYLIFK